LLTTYNGEKYLQDQLDSIAGQTYRNWKLYASDDGSTDSTLDILQRFQRQHGANQVHLFAGPRKGFAQNFLSLIRNPDIRADYFAFCDQDDVWFADKLKRAVTRLNVMPDATSAAVYCSRTRLIDEVGGFIGYSPCFKRPPSFRNALVQSLAGANTMLLNQSARALLARVPITAPVVSHDWLCYLLVTGSGGEVIYDAEPTLDYRQHGGNLIGSNSSWADRLVRVRRMLSGTFRQWNQDNLVALRVAGRAKPLCYRPVRAGAADEFAKTVFFTQESRRLSTDRLWYGWSDIRCVYWKALTRDYSCNRQRWVHRSQLRSRLARRP